MKVFALILVFGLTAAMNAVLAVTVTPLLPSEFVDTEVSTNIAFVADRSIMTRIEFTLALEATPTNNVEIAIGTDGNGDGNLARGDHQVSCPMCMKWNTVQVMIKRWSWMEMVHRESKNSTISWKE